MFTSPAFCAGFFMPFYVDEITGEVIELEEDPHHLAGFRRHKVTVAEWFGAQDPSWLEREKKGSHDEEYKDAMPYDFIHRLRGNQ